MHPAAQLHKDHAMKPHRPTQASAEPAGIDQASLQTEAQAAPVATLGELSAWMDGEAGDPQAAEAAQWLGADPAHEAWHHYHLIGEALRATAAMPFVATAHSASATHARDRAAQVVALARERASAEALSLLPVVVTPGPVVVQAAPAMPYPPRTGAAPPAANDAIFRWKMLAGVASLAAVLGVAFGVGGGESPLNGPQLAQAPAPAVATAVMAAPSGDQGRPATRLTSANVNGIGNRVALASAPALAPGATDAPSAAVWVSTPQGNMLRDPRLEALVQAHQQAGGASAWQVPAGFLRNATFHATQR